MKATLPTRSRTPGCPSGSAPSRSSPRCTARRGTRWCRPAPRNASDGRRWPSVRSRGALHRSGIGGASGAETPARNGPRDAGTTGLARGRVTAGEALPQALRQLTHGVLRSGTTADEEGVQQVNVSLATALDGGAAPCTQEAAAQLPSGNYGGTEDTEQARKPTPPPTTSCRGGVAGLRGSFLPSVPRVGRLSDAGPTPPARPYRTSNSPRHPLDTQISVVPRPQVELSVQGEPLSCRTSEHAGATPDPALGPLSALGFAGYPLAAREARARRCRRPARRP